MQITDLNTLAEGGCNHRALPANEKPPAVRVDDCNLKPPDSLGVKFRFTDEQEKHLLC